MTYPQSPNREQYFIPGRSLEEYSVLASALGDLRLLVYRWAGGIGVGGTALIESAGRHKEILRRYREGEDL